MNKEIMFRFLMLIFSLSFTVLNAQTTWTGNIDSDWSKNGNWTAGKPDANDKVTIQNATNDPIIMAGTNAFAKAVVIQLHGILTIEATAVLTIDNSSGHGLENLATLDNSGEIRIGTNTLVNKIGLRNNNMIHNRPGGKIIIDKCGEDGVHNRRILKNYENAEIHIDEALGHGFNNISSGSFTAILNNFGSIIIGANQKPAMIGLRNAGADLFNKPTGLIKIEGAISHGLTSFSMVPMLDDFLNEGTVTVNGVGGDGIRYTGVGGSTFQNKNTIKIGNTGTIGGTGLFNNGAVFLLKGLLTIDNCAVNGMQFGGFGEMRNDGQIKIGDLGSIGENGIRTNSGSTSFPTLNKSGASITINNVGMNGILSTGGGGFQNNGQVFIGNSGPGSIGQNGIRNEKRVKNNSGAITIYHATLDGISNASTGNFENAATLSIGNNIQNVFGQHGITNEGTFTNGNCRKITCSGKIDNSGTFKNNGYFVSTYFGTNNQTGTFTNKAIIEDVNGAFIGVPMTNKEVVVSPIVDCINATNEFQPALNLGDNPTFTISSTWYTNPAMTNSAGTFDQANNKFTSTLAAGTHQLYFNIQKSGSCNKNVMLNMTITADGPPIAACKDLEIMLDINQNANITANDVDNGSNDACSAVTLAIDQSNFDCSNNGINTVTLTLEDDNNNTATCTSQVTIIEHPGNPCCVAPEALCKDYDAILDGTGNVSITYNDVDNGSTANCGLQSMEIDLEDFDCSHLGIPQTVTLTITDINSDFDFCTAIVTVKDETKPALLNCPSSITQSMEPGQCGATISWIAPTAIDNCDSNPIIAQTQGALSNSFFIEGTQTIKYKATDASSNESDECIFTVTILPDAELPDPQCQNKTIQLDNTGNASISTSDIDNNSSDNCGIQSLALSKEDFTCSDIGENTITLMVTDNTNNTASCTSTITVESLATLSITDVSKLEGSTGGNNIYLFQVNRSMEGCLIEVDYATADGAATTGNNDYIAKSGSITFSASGSNTKTIAIQVVQDSEIELDENFFVNLSNPSIAAQITDGQGEGIVQNDDSASISIDDVSVDENAGVATFTVSLNANLSGGFSVDYDTSDDTAQDENGDNDYASANGTLNFAGNAGETQTISININNDDKVELDETFKVNLSNLQTNGLSLSIADSEGIGTIQNEDTATLSIDDVNKLEGNNGTTDYIFSVSLSGNVDVGISTDWQTQDNTATTINNDYASANGTLNFVGNDGESQTLTVQVNSDCEVEMEESFFVNLSNLQANGRSISFSNATGIATIQNDDSNPNISNCPSNMTVNADSSCGYKLGNFTSQVTTSGGCGGITVNQNPPLGSTIGLGVNTITITATDASGNIASCNFDIEVVDNTAPSALCNNLTVWINPGSSVTIMPNSVDGGSSDNCSTVSLSLDQTSFDCSQVGTNTVTLTATDAVGLQSSCTATVTVVGITVTCYLDADNDGYGDAANTQIFCIACETGYVDNAEDCDDSNANLNSNTSEICDGIDNNCDGNIDEGFDQDNDGFSTCQGDCDDNNPTAFPGNTEICDDGIDNDCNGQIDEGCDPDNDSDGFTVGQGDCNDNDITIFPGAPEICDGIDNNCDGNIDEGYDLDADGFTTCAGDCDDSNATIFPGALEICDGLDNDCNGQIDEGLPGETFVGNVVFTTQAQIDDFPSCFSSIEGDVVINGIGIIDLTPLSNLTNITGDLLIQQTSLTTLAGLENIVFVGSSFILVFNSNLTDCCPVGVLISSGVTGLVYIAGNSTGCENQPAIIMACSAAPLVANPNSGNSIIATQVERRAIEALVFPNPASTELNIYLKDDFESGIIQLIDMQGRVVLKQDAQAHNQLNINNLSSGIYILKYQIDRRLQSQKILVE